MAKPDESSLEIYIAEILGDVGKLHKLMEDLKDDVPKLLSTVTAAADSFESRTKVAVATSTASAKNSTLRVACAGVALCAVVFGSAGYLIRAGADAMSLSAAASRVNEANSRADTAIADAEKKALVEVEELKKTGGWAATEQGRQAKKFFDSGAGPIAISCHRPDAWDIKITPEGKFCVPRRRPLFGGEEHAYGWPIP